jgi:hypothetical protein
MNTKIINSLVTDIKKRKKINDDLTTYVFIQNVCDLKIGCHIRMIDLTKSPYNLQGVVNLINISIEDTHINITCKTFSNKYFKKRYDDLVIFKKMTSI